MFDTDVLVVGGGPAGLAAALAIRAQGMRVVTADAARLPIDKTCGEGLMPDSLAALRALGVTVSANDGFAFNGIRFLDDDSAVGAKFPSDVGVGMRRPLLHARMVRAAEDAGVHMLWGARVSGIDGHDVRVDGQVLRARWIVGADGLNSRVRRWAGLGDPVGADLRFGFRRHYAVAPWSEFMEIYWGPAAQIYVTPVGPQSVCVVLISRDQRLRMENALAQFPRIAERLAGVPALNSERGALTTTRKLRRIAVGSVALIGDASGSVDAVTGEGMCVAFQQAPVLARALAAGDLAQYNAAHERIIRKPQFMARMMLLLDGRPWLRRRVLRGMQSNPRIFQDLLAMHVGEFSPRALVVNGAALTRQLLVS